MTINVIKNYQIFPDNSTSEPSSNLTENIDLMMSQKRRILNSPVLEITFALEPNANTRFKLPVTQQVRYNKYTARRNVWPLQLDRAHVYS